MAGGRGCRKIPIDKKKAKEVRGLLGECKNNTERKRVIAVSTYLGGLDIEKTAEALGMGTNTVHKALNSYLLDEKKFYKTKHKGKIESKERQKIKNEVKEIVEDMINNDEKPDINQVLRKLNQKHNEEVMNYNSMRWILRRRYKYGYQKPFVTNQKQSDHAEKIVKGRLTKAIIEIQMEENIDVGIAAIKNKKTKNGGNNGR